MGNTKPPKKAVPLASGGWLWIHEQDEVEVDTPIYDYSPLCFSKPTDGNYILESGIEIGVTNGIITEVY
jgi:hypothetical protein